MSKIPAIFVDAPTKLCNFSSFFQFFFASFLISVLTFKMRINFSKQSQRKLLLSLATLTLIGFSNQARAKELTNRLGVGFRTATVYDIPSLAAFYYPNHNLGVVGTLGIDTLENNSKFAFGVGIRRIIFKEENMNFFGGGNIHLLSVEEYSSSTSTASTNSGMELSGVVGGEFFLSGLDSLGFNFETGVAVTNVKKVRFRTVADHIFRAGISFYF